MKQSDQLTSLEIARQRLQNHLLTGQGYAEPDEVVRWHGAVQGQEYPYAKWALGRRMRLGISEAVIEQAFNEGRILRTHVMRPTWHFVTPADIRWILELTAPRVHKLNAYWDRRLELDAATLLRATDAIASALEGGRHLTRKELASALQQVGIIAAGQRLAYIVMHAELDAIICSGPRRGKQFSYALLAERAPQARSLLRDEALAELTRRYFLSHGPALPQDYAWWSGLTVADARAGLELAKGYLIPDQYGGKTYWRSATAAAYPEDAGAVHLLPVLDEYLIAYKDYSPVLDQALEDQVKNGDLAFASFFTIDGHVAGMWKPTFLKGAIRIETTSYRSLTAAETAALGAEANRFGEFFEMPVTLS
jgi:hypothetical protein